MLLSARQVPTTTEVPGIVGEAEVHTLDDLKAQRPKTVAFELAKLVLDRYFQYPDSADGDGMDQGPRPWLFPRLVEIARSWMAECVTCQDNAFPQLLLLHEYRSDAAERIYHSIVRTAGGERRLLRCSSHTTPWDRQSRWTSTRRSPSVRPTPTSATSTTPWRTAGGNTCWTWTSKRFRRFSATSRTKARIHHPVQPRWTAEGYYPDFLVDLDDGRGADDPLHLIIEVSGERDRAKQIKVDTARTLWIPAVNNAERFGRWRFVEVTDPFEGADIIRSIVAETTTAGAS